MEREISRRKLNRYFTDESIEKLNVSLKVRPLRDFFSFS